MGLHHAQEVLHTPLLQGVTENDHLCPLGLCVGDELVTGGFPDLD